MAGRGMTTSTNGKLPASVRRVRLIELLRRDGFMNVSNAAASLGVTSMTIRRDLATLSQAGEIERTHGGALRAFASLHASSESADEPEFEERRRMNRDAKLRIAVAAAKLIGHREAIGLDVGTTTLALARQISGRRDLSIVTNSLRAATLLAHAQIGVYLLGGHLRAPELSVVGPMAEAQAQQFFLTRMFLAVSGVTSDGLYDYSPEDSRVKQAMMDKAEQIVLVCDSSKVGQRSLARICGLERIDILVTDRTPDEELLNALREHAIRLVVAGQEPAAGAGP